MWEGFIFTLIQLRQIKICANAKQIQNKIYNSTKTEKIS